MHSQQLEVFKYRLGCFMNYKAIVSNLKFLDTVVTETWGESEWQIHELPDAPMFVAFTKDKLCIEAELSYRYGFCLDKIRVVTSDQRANDRKATYSQLLKLVEPYRLSTGELVWMVNEEERQLYASGKKGTPEDQRRMRKFLNNLREFEEGKE